MANMLHKNINIQVQLPTGTADGRYCFTEEFYGKPLSEWVYLTHKFMSEQMGWEITHLFPGTFGYDNFAHSVAHALLNRERFIEDMARLVHEGWIHNYIWWRDNKPWLINSKYRQPWSPLGDPRREECARLDYADLPEEEKRKDQYIASFLLQSSG